ncbi:kinase [Anopheles sinensis]|uniref:Kinase n=1 Tax=Anopheles sinensis TaxID=74873 RepID=A0A084VWT2_ANOSI|nr:kinase [Anopheles sinensis]
MTNEEEPINYALQQARRVTGSDIDRIPSGTLPRGVSALTHFWGLMLTSLSTGHVRHSVDPQKSVRLTVDFVSYGSLIPPFEHRPISSSSGGGCGVL